MQCLLWVFLRKLTASLEQLIVHIFFPKYRSKYKIKPNTSLAKNDIQYSNLISIFQDQFYQRHTRIQSMEMKTEMHKT